MGFWDRFIGRKEEAGSVTSSLDLFRQVYGSRLSEAGVPVNWDTALKVSTVLACCRVRAEGLSVPFRLYQETSGGRKIASDHPLHMLISRRPNGWQTSLEFLETISFHLDLKFNAYVFVNRVGRGREVRELIPIEPGRVRVEQRPDYSLHYYVRAKDGAEQEFGQDAIWHLRGPSWNSWIGMDAIALAANAIGLSMSLERGQSEGQKNGLQSSAVYSVKEKLTPEKFQFLAAWMDKHLPGGERAGKPMILDMDADIKSKIMSAIDQQLIETRKFQIEEICRSLRVWPIMVGHAGDQSPTFASASEFFQAHKTYTLDPLYRRISQSANINLLSPEELKAGYYSKFVVNALMSTAPKDKAEYYQKALGSGNAKGWLTQNEVRDLEDMDKSDEPEADELPQPSAAAAAKPADKPAPDPGAE
ncbi:HK97 family phage portal protein [Bradyrhizobium sp. GM0.4]